MPILLPDQKYCNVSTALPSSILPHSGTVTRGAFWESFRPDLWTSLPVQSRSALNYFRFSAASSSSVYHVPNISVILTVLELLS